MGPPSPRRILKAPEGRPKPGTERCREHGLSPPAPRRNTPPPSTTGWVGLLEPNQSRALGHSALEISTLTSFGYQVKHCFHTHEEAITWLGEGHPGPGRAPAPNHGHQNNPQAPAGREHVTTSGPDTSKDKAELCGV
jgi:hypothetical protein